MSTLHLKLAVCLVLFVLTVGAAYWDAWTHDDAD